MRLFTIRESQSRSRAPVAAVLACALAAVLAACSPTPASETPPGPGAGSPASGPTGAGPTGAGPGTPSTRTTLTGRKVLVVVEENHTYADVLGNARAPYLAGLARTFASLSAMQAGYPPSCPSLPAYLLMTSGSTHGICDNADPSAHPVDGPSIFSQVEDAGGQWRGYAESMPAPCTAHDASSGRYVVHHAPIPYYTTALARCPAWDLPLGTPDSGALHDDVAAGRLPDYGFVTPDVCHDMHGADSCPGDLVAAADQWLATWIPRVLAGPDYRAGRLVVVLTWDEGSGDSNHIPTVVVASAVHAVQVTQPVTHCGLLRLEEQLLGVPALACARGALSPGPALGLPPAA